MMRSAALDWRDLPPALLFLNVSLIALTFYFCFQDGSSLYPSVFLNPNPREASGSYRQPIPVQKMYRDIVSAKRADIQVVV